MVRDYLITYFFPCKRLLCKERERMLFSGVLRESSCYWYGDEEVTSGKGALLIAEIEFLGAAGCAFPATPAACGPGQKMQACSK